MHRFTAYRVYLVLSAVTAFANATMFVTLAVYYIQAVAMTPFQLVLVGTAVELSVLVFEIPTGIVADAYSRRVSVIIGLGILGVAWILEGIFPLFAAILVAEVLRGVGETFLSGALDAWLADEVGEEHIGAVYLRSGQIRRISGLLGTGASALLASIALNLPLLIGGTLFLSLSVFLALAMPENGFVPTPRGERTTWQSMIDTFWAGAGAVRRSQTLTLLLLVNLFAGVASEGFDRLWEAHLLADVALPTLGALKPVVWFSIIGMAGALISFAVTALFQRRLEALSQRPAATIRVLLWFQVLAVVSVVSFALAERFDLAVAALLLKGVVESLTGPLYSAWLVQHTSARVRATAFSMISQTNALGQSLGGPGVGAVGNRSLRVALTLAGLLLAPAMLLYAWAGRSEQVNR